MSTSVARAWARRLAAVALATWAGAPMGCAGAAAQEPPIDPLADEVETPVDMLMGGMAAYVDSLVEGREWDGQRVPWPDPRDRPVAVAAAESDGWGVVIHQEPGALDRASARAWAEALDRAHELLARDGWPTAPPDGGRGGTNGLDVYLLDQPESERPSDGLEPEPGPASRGPRRSEVRLDAPLFLATQDAAIVHVAVSADVAADRVLACAVQLAAEAGLFASDPGEASSLRHATGAWLAWTYTGHAGCDEDALVRQQTQSFRGLVSDDARDGEGGALLLAAISARHDAAETGFLRDVWLAARQRTRDDGDLRGEPDVLRVLGQVATLAHDPLDRVIESVAVARYFAGARGGAARPDVQLLRELPATAVVPVFATTTWSELPERLRSTGPALEPWGSAYARVDVRDAPSGSQLRVWLDGETGTEWSLVAVRLGADGAERGRTRAPPTRRTRAYIPVELLEGTAEVVLVITNVPDDDDPRDRTVTASRDATIAGRVPRVGRAADAPGPGAPALRHTAHPGPRRARVAPKLSVGLGDRAVNDQHGAQGVGFIRAGRPRWFAMGSVPKG